MATDPKLAARAAMEAAERAREAAAAASAAANQPTGKTPGESPRSPDAGTTGVIGSTAAIGATATGVPLDVFTEPNATASDSTSRDTDLSVDEQRMADASGAGRTSALSPGKPGETATPDFSGIGSPGGTRQADGPGTGENPFGD